MLTTSVFTNSLVPLYSRQGFWFWQLFRCSSFLPNKCSYITLDSIRIDSISSQAEWASLRLCDLQEEIFIIQLDLIQGPSEMGLASLHSTHQKKDFILAMTEECESMNCDFT